MPLPDLPELLQKKQVAARLNCSSRTIDRLVAEGKLARPSYVGGRPCWAAMDVEVYLWRVLRRDFDDIPPPAEEDNTDK